MKKVLFILWGCLFVLLSLACFNKPEDPVWIIAPPAGLEQTKINQTRQEAERVGKYMIRPVLSLERISFDEKEGKVC
jgi:hypothetical protein